MVARHHKAYPGSGRGGPIAKKRGKNGAGTGMDDAVRRGIGAVRIWIRSIAAHLARWWWIYGIVALVFWLMIAVPGDLGSLSLLQLAGTEAQSADAIDQLGGASSARIVVLLNLGLLIPWLAVLAGLAWRLRNYYYSDALRRTAEPVVWAAGLAFVAGVARSVILMLRIPDLGQTWVTASAVAGWATWMFIIVAVAYTVPMFLARFLPTSWRLDPVNTLTLEDTDSDRFPDIRDPWRKVRMTPGGRRVGISVSGGGMRSAAFNLGALQRLDEAGTYGAASYVSAVSGGAYIAGAYAIARNESPNAAPRVFGRGSTEESFVRDRSTYLAPGPGGRFRLIGRLLLGIFINVLIIGLTVVVVGRGIGYFLSSYLLYPELQQGEVFVIRASSWWTVIVLGGGALACAMMGGYRRHRSEVNRNTWFIAAGLLLVMAVLMLILHIILPWIILEGPGLAARSLEGASTPQPEDASAAWWLSLGGVTALLAGAVRSVVAKNRSRFAMIVGGLVVPALVIIGLLMAIRSTVRVGFPADPFGAGSAGLWWTVAAAALLFVLVARSDITTWSMHQFYKRRLASAFATRRENGRAVAIDFNELEPISSLGTGDPKLVVCAAANITDETVTPPGRYAVTFTFSSTEVGGPDVGYEPTPDYETTLGDDRSEDITVPATIAISGAAISPAMGKMGRGRRSIGSALALANVRLGVWLPNPWWIRAEGMARAQERESKRAKHEDEAARPKSEEEEAERVRSWKETPHATYLAKELAGRYALKDKFLYITDGGHWENLGLVELLRRGCTEVYCFDAAGDKAGEYSTLGEAIALARAELNVEISIDPTTMRPAEAKERYSPRGHAVGTFQYLPNGPKGRILFVKAALVEDATWDVKAYAERTPDFPNQPTFDQLFEDDQFEAHRALGYHLTEQAIQSDEWSNPYPDPPESRSTNS